jgi:hypothetical protein
MKPNQIFVTVKTELALLLPSIPNFIRTPDNDCIDVGDLTELQVREIGAKWTDALWRKARERKGAVIRKMNKEIQGESD